MLYQYICGCWYGWDNKWLSNYTYTWVTKNTIYGVLHLKNGETKNVLYRMFIKASWFGRFYLYEIDKKLTLDLCFVNCNIAHTHVDGESGSELEILKYIIVGNQYMTHNTWHIITSGLTLARYYLSQSSFHRGQVIAMHSGQIRFVPRHHLHVQCAGSSAGKNRFLLLSMCAEHFISRCCFS